MLPIPPSTPSPISLYVQVHVWVNIWIFWYTIDRYQYSIMLLRFTTKECYHIYVEQTYSRRLYSGCWHAGFVFEEFWPVIESDLSPNFDIGLGKDPNTVLAIDQ